MDLPDPTPEPDRDAFNRLVATYYGPIGRLVFRLLGWQDGSEDVVQEVFLSAWAARARFPGLANAELWLKRIAVNKCRSRLRRKAVRARWFAWLHAVSHQEPQVVPEDSLAKEERVSRVRRAIQSLDSRYREVTVLHYLEQMSVDEIAQVVGQRRNAVEVRLHRARAQLEKLLTDLME
jgi:RNA polymerase sigma factor (sigma-70 family)